MWPTAAEARDTARPSSRAETWCRGFARACASRTPASLPWDASPATPCEPRAGLSGLLRPLDREQQHGGVSAAGGGRRRSAGSFDHSPVPTRGGGARLSDHTRSILGNSGRPAALSAGSVRAETKTGGRPGALHALSRRAWRRAGGGGEPGEMGTLAELEKDP